MHRLILGFLASGVITSSAVAQSSIIPGRFIVLVKAGNKPSAVAGAYGVGNGQVYDSAVNGFAGSIPAGRLGALKRDSRVQLLEPDRLVSTLGRVVAVGTSGAATVSATGDLLPTGVRRIRADLNPRLDFSAVGVAIIDTGISLSHPDLSVAGGVSYVSGVKSPNDDNGHGSHVAGIVAAKANGKGVRGVAPNASLYAVKVLDRTGSGSLSAVISGINWVTKNARARNIKVANMSLGFNGTSTTLDSAIKRSVSAGVTYVVAAGNSAADASAFSPARNPYVIAVSAMADSDGHCGSAGVPTGYGTDDAFASFSNHGAVVDLAAPGVGIYSTYLNGSYATMSGTSMAAPHVTGAVALFLAGQAASPSGVRSALLSNATPQLPVACATDAFGDRGGFANDVDAHREPLADAAGF